MATPTSAGRVLIRPLGDYDASTTYEMLDSVEYQDASYLCKQTSTGNLPTNKTYWQKLASMGAGSYMAVDGSNADNVRIGNDTSDYTLDEDLFVSTITKESGSNKSLIMTRITAHSNAGALETRYKIYIDAVDVLAYYGGEDVRVPFVIDSVATTAGSATDTITITAHLQEDVTDAISLMATDIYAKYFVDGNYNIILGDGKDVVGDGNLLVGNGNNIKGSSGLASGYNNVINGDNAAAFGNSNYIGFKESFAIGRSLMTQARDQFVVGHHNDNKANTLFEVGNGGSSKRNAFEVYASGKISCDNGNSSFLFTSEGGKHGYYDESSSTFHPFEAATLYLTQSVTLSTSEDTIVTFGNAAITTDSMIDVYTSEYGINPKNVVATTATCTLTFAKVNTAQTITVRIAVRNV